MGYLDISWVNVLKAGTDLIHLIARPARNVQVSHPNAYTLKVVKGKFVS